MVDGDFRAIEDKLPPKTVFPQEMPRYPNVWFLVDRALTLRGRYKHAVQLVVRVLETQLQMRDTFVQGIHNHQLYHLLAEPGEGSDFQARIGPLHHYRVKETPELSHSHQVHARFYPSALVRAKADAIECNLYGRPRTFFALPASVHYEVATEEPTHPYVDTCTLCGITGEYDIPIDRSGEDYCIEIHDPLGVEYLLYGTIRGSRLPEDKAQPFSGLSGVKTEEDRWSVHSVASTTQDPKRFGFVVVTPDDT